MSPRTAAWIRHIIGAAGAGELETVRARQAEHHGLLTCMADARAVACAPGEEYSTARHAEAERHLGKICRLYMAGERIAGAPRPAPAPRPPIAVLLAAAALLLTLAGAAAGGLWGEPRRAVAAPACGGAR